ncbi:hypothetical protein N781_00765 [Pontibacillus halophilus JSM 076056 = DSM 19796]|uniref:DUF2188 domain-containing protein n=1 Tax=Pontibacillus halophilus JSM 076056 = DSM 19796 TaxID=1385510 RepID=A0A0A5GRH1_9BACI|nr:DUF2188 domain-containing protein [Pontibacillus halophilus]KGX93765.1 hypothetical protein N781_00765 [Pontibacillus halophilus JSM 076056 = DSM 19796]
MKQYTVEPNKDATGWFVKIEGDAPTDLFDAKDAAIEKAEQFAQDNKPSRVTIYDKHNNVETERTY